MNLAFRVSSIKLRHDLEYDTYTYVLCDENGKELWESGSFRMMPGDTASLIFPEDVTVTVSTIGE